MYIGNYYGGYSGSYIMLLIPALLFTMYAQFKVSSSFNKYLRISNETGYTGAQIARMILDRNGLYDVRIEQTGGNLTDHYDPRTKVVRLSRNVYGGNSIASMSVAAHEVGHAIQHADGYFPLVLRNNIAPIVNIGARFVWIFVFLGFIISPFLIELAILIYLGVVLFQVVTLPVEFNASSRALYQLQDGIIPRGKEKPVKEVLGAAAMTYVAATLVSVVELIRLLSISSRRRD